MVEKLNCFAVGKKMFKTSLCAGYRLARAKINTATLGTATRQFSSALRILQTRDISKCSHVKRFSSVSDEPVPVDHVKFEQVCNETLESLCDYFEELVERSSHLRGADVTFGDGVLTVAFGIPYGTYVINRQTPNKQIWLSSPASGPKRYDLVLDNGGYWVYKHTGVTLHQLLQKEIPNIIQSKCEVDFSKCAHGLV